MKWEPIETAPKGGGADLVTDPAYVRPPKVLLLFEGGEQVVCHWDWYYAEGGNGYREGVSAWVEPVSGEQVSLHYDNPTHWMSLAEPPNAVLSGAADEHNQRRDASPRPPRTRG